MASFILDHRDWLRLAEMALITTSFSTSMIYFLVTWLRKKRPIRRSVPMRTSSVMLALALAMQVMVVSAAGDGLLTLFAFAGFCFVVYMNFMRQSIGP